MKISASLLLLPLTQWAVGAPLFLFLKNLPARPGSPDRSRPSRSYSPAASRVTSTEERLGFLDRLSDASAPRLDNAAPRTGHPSTPRPPVGNPSGLREPAAPPTGRLELPPTVIELEMEGLASHVYLPCHSHQNTLHYYRVRKWADLMVFGALVSFVAALLLVELWGRIYSSCRYRANGGAIRLEDGEGEKAKSNFQRKECISYRSSVVPQPASKN